MTGVPVWVRVPAIIALVLIATMAYRRWTVSVIIESPGTRDARC